MYIMFPIGWMYYFGTNLDDKFSVKDFWPTKEQLNKIPTEREDIAEEVERMKRRRLHLRDQRLREEAEQARLESGVVLQSQNERTLRGGPLDQYGENVAKAISREGSGWFTWGRSRS